MHYILFYTTIENYIEKRAPFREEHLALAKRYKESGHLIMAGAFANPSNGAALVFNCDDKSLVQDFVDKDPYVQNGLITEWSIREWTVVIGG